MHEIRVLGIKIYKKVHGNFKRFESENRVMEMNFGRESVIYARVG